MNVTKSPMKEIRERFDITQTQFAAAAGISKGHMCEVETGIAQFSQGLRDFLKEMSIDVEAVEEEHKAYMESVRQKYRAKILSAVQMEADNQRRSE